MKHKTKKKYFTLLELLVIVGILAIVGGSLIAAYDGLTAQAAKATATNTIGGLTNAVRSFVVTERSLPNNVESLLAGDPDGGTGYIAAEADSVYTSLASSPVFAGHLGSKLQGKFAITTLTDTQIGNLQAAGITQIRFLDVAGNDEVESDLEIVAADNTAATAVGPISQIDIPQLAFGPPRPGNGRDRGRGFGFTLDVAATAVNLQFPVWSAQSPTSPAVEYDNIKVGGDPLGVLVGFGIGNDSSIVGASSNKTGGVGNVRLSSAPFYGDVGVNEYPHYIMLVDVEQNPAKLVAVVDARGDFLAEEFAESTGQKQ